jgi:hypothetical protein
MKYKVGQKVYYQDDYGFVTSGIIKGIGTGVITGEPLYVLNSGKCLHEKDILEHLKELTTNHEDYSWFDIAKFVRDTMELNKRTVPNIEDVIFSGPATIIKFNDGSKSVVKCDAEDEQNKDVGFLMALVKSMVKKGSYDMILKTMEKYKE